MIFVVVCSGVAFAVDVVVSVGFAFDGLLQLEVMRPAI